MGRRHRDYKAEWESGGEAGEKPRKMCAVSGKRMYANEGEAKATATHRLRDPEAGAKQLRVYRCMYCNAWHLTSKEQ